MLAVLDGLRYAQRRLLKSPGSTLIMVLSLALGIGASVSIFSVVNGVVLRPLPYRNPHEIVTLWWENSSQIGNLASLSPPHFRFLRQDSAVFQDLGLFRSEDVSLTGIGESQVLRGAFVTSSVFDVLGVRAAHGRVFGDDEDKPGGERIALLSDGLWKRSFGEERQILGKTIRLNGKNHLILGVMPEGFEFFA